jgi:hypothetical protein
MGKGEEGDGSAWLRRKAEMGVSSGTGFEHLSAWSESDIKKSAAEREGAKKTRPSRLRGTLVSWVSFMPPMGAFNQKGV